MIGSDFHIQNCRADNIRSETTRCDLSAFRHDPGLMDHFTGVICFQRYDEVAGIIWLQCSDEPFNCVIDLNKFSTTIG